MFARTRFRAGPLSEAAARVLPGDRCFPGLITRTRNYAGSTAHLLASGYGDATAGESVKVRISCQLLIKQIAERQSRGCNVESQAPREHLGEPGHLQAATCEGVHAVRTRGLALLVAGLLLAPTELASSACARDATATGGCATSTEDENKDPVVAFFDAAASGDRAAFAEILVPDHVYHEMSVDVPVATPQSRAEGASEWSNDLKEPITDLTVTVDPIIADGDLVSAMMTWTGENAGTGADITWNSALVP